MDEIPNQDKNIDIEIIRETDMEYLPYINAKRAPSMGTKSCTWGNDDRVLLSYIKLACIIIGLGGFLCMLTIVWNS